MSRPTASPASVWTAAALRWRLAGPGAPRPVVPSIDPDRLLAAVLSHRVVGHFAGADGLGLDALMLDRLHDAQRESAQRALVVMATTRSVSETLAEAGICHLVVKGAALAFVQRVPASLRGGGDVDVWVPPAIAGAAVDALVAGGWSLRHPDPPPRLPSPHWRDRCYAWITPETGLVRGGASIVDLHWRLTRSTRGLALRFDEAWERSVAAPELGPSVRTLCLADALRHVSAHGTRDVWTTLRHVVDVVLLARRIAPSDLVELGEQDPTVGLALSVAANLAPDLARTSRLSRRRQRLAGEAWAECLAQRLRAAELYAAKGAHARLLRVSVVSWQVRSAPGLGAALHPIAEVVLPARAIRDPAPLSVALTRELRLRTRREIRPGTGSDTTRPG